MKGNLYTPIDFDVLSLDILMPFTTLLHTKWHEYPLIMNFNTADILPVLKAYRLIFLNLLLCNQLVRGPRTK